MIATARLCPVLILLCATKLVYTAPRGSYGGYPLDGMDSNMLQNDYFLSKRNKPSLSIVNPLDVLRQRLLLEIARRQMKENTRQVELNRAILKNVGKRVLSKHPYPLASTLLDIQESQQQQQQPMQQLPYDLDLIPTTLIFDYLQQQQQHQRRPWLPFESTAIQFDNINNINDAIEDVVDDDGDADVDAGEKDNIPTNGILVNNEKNFMKHSKQSNNQHLNTFTNEQEQTSKKPINRNSANKVATLLNHHKNDLNDINPAYQHEIFHNVNNVNNINNNEADNDQSAANYQVQRYLYHLHKNHLTRK